MEDFVDQLLEVNIMINIEWTLRISFLVFLYINWLFYAILLKNREKYSRIAENPRINTLMVILYNSSCYLTAGILPASSESIWLTWSGNDSWSNNILLTIIRCSGLLVIGIGIYLTVSTFRQRNAIGIQKTPAGLINSGPYQIARHPIYLGIILNSLGVGLLFLNFDGLLVFPLIIIVNLLEGYTEEIFDLLPRFKDDYVKYRKMIPILGKPWIWGLILGVYSSVMIILW
jgi:protein-S-isoprenylcysteine O-methyltransferase Ste14